LLALRQPRVFNVRRSAPRRHCAAPSARATKVSPTYGWCATPTTTRVPSCSAISVAQCIWPRMKLRVPSIGSITQV
jgi:hypothetical protein